MKRFFTRLLGFFLAAVFLNCCVPAVSAEAVVPDLTGYIRSAPRRRFVQSMLNFYLTENAEIRWTLENGYSALFFFEGCSDNMDDETLSDISYYRVSAVCLALRLNDEGQPEIVYFNDNCSTLPDRPLEYGAWELEEVGPVGPATVCDGTYPMYSVYHSGAYEAFHIRADYEDETMPAVYMIPKGFVTSRATCINVHTRTVNHILKEAMWSAGCILVGYDDYEGFSGLIRNTYYEKYKEFDTGRLAGTVTVNRLMLKDQLYALYGDQMAVDELLTASRCDDPAVYLQRCEPVQPLGEEKTVQTLNGADLMSLPCDRETDIRSISVLSLEKDDKIDICGSVVNTEGQLWYEVQLLGGNCYILSENVREVPKHWLMRLYEFFFR